MTPYRGTLCSGVQRSIATLAANGSAVAPALHLPPRHPGYYPLAKKGVGQDETFIRHDWG